MSHALDLSLEAEAVCPACGADVWRGFPLCEQCWRSTSRELRRASVRAWMAAQAHRTTDAVGELLRANRACVDDAVRRRSS